MIRGSCLCGGVRFEIARAVGPFELCHCSRCRKASGSAFAAGVGVDTADYRLLEGRELIGWYDAPLLEAPPAYRTYFCRRCGSPAPDPDPQGAWFEIPAGLLDDDPLARPDKHIFVERKSAWFAIEDGLPQLDKQQLVALRRSGGRVADPPSSRWRVAPVLIVASALESMKYYRDRLGFDVVGTLGDPLEMAFVGRGGVQLMLQGGEGKTTPGSNRGYKPIAWDVLFWVEDVDALHAELLQRGAEIISPPHSTFYGTREAEAADPDGHVLCFCQVPR